METLRPYLEPYLGELLSMVVLNIGVVLAALLLAHVAHRLALRVYQGSGRFLMKRMAESVQRYTERPTWWLFMFMALNMALPVMDVTVEWEARLHRIIYPLTIAVFGWLLIGIAHGVSHYMRERYAWEAIEDNLAVRRIHTQLRVFTRVVVFIIGTMTVLGIAMTIPSLRNIGLSLFASAGVAGLAVGMAARPALGNMIAGIQLALTQPIRIDDAVIVEGEFGRVEEITGTYVVVKLWDLRRLVVPLSYFIETPFQNWTHSSSNLIGTVFLYLDYGTPVESIREELLRILEDAPAWNRETAAVQVTDCKESTMEIRVLVSANDAGQLFGLRCLVRERLIAWLEREHPQSLPKARAQIAFSGTEEQAQPPVPEALSATLSAPRPARG